MSALVLAMTRRWRAVLAALAELSLAASLGLALALTERRYGRRWPHI